MATQIQLPEFPKRGHGTALQLESQRKRYRIAGDALRRELAKAEDAFAAVLADRDQRDQTKARLAAMARKNRADNLKK
ncbi:hypothetical protein IWX78_001159 [Mycetocola sp. CAN_C7]|uniref:hypothetical protein n=1 Tax=Mycetocola sp. CAN_C7 TaxID=2787724 RepID=UPI0018C91EC8